MSDDQAREMRPETTSEHIARDMREGRFPEQSERQMVPVLASLPHEIQVWRSMDALDHTGTWSTTRYPAEAVTYVSKADAQAAVALVVEQAADACVDLAAQVSNAALTGLPEQARLRESMEAAFTKASHVIRALAPADGLAAVEALRATADGYKHAAEGFAAELAAAKQRERALVEALETGRHYVHQLANGGLPGSCEASEDLTGIDAALAEVQADARREGGSPLTDETPAQHEERTCTCGAGHGSLEGHMDWCDFTAYQSLNALAEVQARDDAPTPPDTWHERRTMLPDGDARKGEG